MTPQAHSDERVRIFGIRHHGPGSARALGRALGDFKPEVVLIEGPPEADPIVALAADAGMVPPVALLAYVPADGADGAERAGGDRRAAFWPFAEFSPEWQAIRHALAAEVPVRFCDLPAAHQLAETPDHHPGPSGPAPDGPDGEPRDDALPGGDAEPKDEEAEALERVRHDPLGRLAEAAGYDDAERWWDDVVEHRGEGPAPFEAIAEAMTTLREHAPAMPEAHVVREERREAYMRKTLRRALRDGYERIAVVCGAWHVPGIAAGLGPARGSGTITAADDDRTLRGMPKAKVALTWVPWTHGRLSGRTGYGAGVRSPGWYHHLFTEPDRPVERWLTEAARVLRDEDLPVSSAHVIEAVRLADALAVLRGRPLAGLDEVTEATLAVLCEGAELPAQLIQRRMVVGERLGSVPDSTPMVPLQRDLQAEQRRVRLRPSALEKEHDLDLRKPLDLDRSRLLHRLRLLNVPWGEPAESGRTKGTFREAWTLLWRPIFDIELIEASAWGTTVRGAAAAKARSLAADAEALADLTALAERCLLADLGDALPDVMRTLADRAAADTDVAHLMAALPALVRTLRYGDVRGTSTGPLRTVVDGLVVRVCVGLPPTVSGIDDDAARTLLGHIDGVHAALALLDDAAHIARWQDTLAGLIDRPGLHGLIEGRLTRLLLDAGLLEDTPAGGTAPHAPREELGRVTDRMARAVSVGESPARAAAWIEGFLAGGGLVLVHDEPLLRLVDGWIAGLSPEWFTDVLPLLRRTFADFESPERRAIGERVRHLGPARRPVPALGDPGDEDGPGLDAARAAPAAQTVLRILGWPPSPP
ncbi:DUF5682 family protein [Actinomadura sp. HBU206391]|uniref:DUF5682 family protein n=1 Tax=Actinomadura sp. HBU206391 TaxID=2731692 RepID=UPI00165083D4|nr:DUF5682 family protein [Actinomadura sp. HBU206391]MBC6460409.1 hypothetical protein [Actinomadura sp. HBU206391]